MSAGPGGFRADTHLVQINVIVHDKNGPVTNLNQSDFTITDHGKPRTISIFAVHKPAAAVPAASVKAVPPPVPVNTFSNSALRGVDAPPSVTVILLDRLNTMIGGVAANAETPLFSSDLALSNAKQQLVKYLDELDPHQRVAIYSLGQGITVLSDFTGDRARLKTILENYRATSITSQEVAEPTTVHLASAIMTEQVNRDSQLLAGMSNAQRAQTTMAALMAVAAHIAEIPTQESGLADGGSQHSRCCAWPRAGPLRYCDLSGRCSRSPVLGRGPLGRRRQCGRVGANPRHTFRSRRGSDCAARHLRYAGARRKKPVDAPTSTATI